MRFSLSSAARVATCSSSTRMRSSAVGTSAGSAPGSAWPRPATIAPARTTETRMCLENPRPGNCARRVKFIDLLLCLCVSVSVFPCLCFRVCALPLAPRVRPTPGSTGPAPRHRSEVESIENESQYRMRGLVQGVRGFNGCRPIPRCVRGPLPRSAKRSCLGRTPCLFPSIDPLADLSGHLPGEPGG